MRGNCEEMRLGTGLGTDDGESKRMIGNAHDKTIDRRCTWSHVFGSQWEPLCVGGDESIARLVASPNTDATTDG